MGAGSPGVVGEAHRAESEGDARSFQTELGGMVWEGHWGGGGRAYV